MKLISVSSQHDQISTEGFGGDGGFLTASSHISHLGSWLGSVATTSALTDPGI